MLAGLMAGDPAWGGQLYWGVAGVVLRSLTVWAQAVAVAPGRAGREGGTALAAARAGAAQRHPGRRPVRRRPRHSRDPGTGRPGQLLHPVPARPGELRRDPAAAGRPHPVRRLDQRRGDRADRAAGAALYGPDRPLHRGPRPGSPVGPGPAVRPHAGAGQGPARPRGPGPRHRPAQGPRGPLRGVPPPDHGHPADRFPLRPRAGTHRHHLRGRRRRLHRRPPGPRRHGARGGAAGPDPRPRLLPPAPGAGHRPPRQRRRPCRARRNHRRPRKRPSPRRCGPPRPHRRHGSDGGLPRAPASARPGRGRADGPLRRKDGRRRRAAELHRRPGPDHRPRRAQRRRQEHRPRACWPAPSGPAAATATGNNRHRTARRIHDGGPRLGAAASRDGGPDRAGGDPAVSGIRRGTDAEVQRRSGRRHGPALPGGRAPRSTWPRSIPPNSARGSCAAWHWPAAWRGSRPVPRVLLLDEPTAHLDRESATAVSGAIAALRGQVTVLLVAHDRQTRELADDVVAVAPPAPRQSGRRTPSRLAGGTGAAPEPPGAAAGRGAAVRAAVAAGTDTGRSANRPPAAAGPPAAPSAALHGPAPGSPAARPGRGQVRRAPAPSAPWRPSSPSPWPGSPAG